MKRPSNVTSTAAILGMALMLLRQRQELTQEDLSSAVGISQSAWSRIERGITSLSVLQLRLAADRLGLTSSLILEAAETAEFDVLSGGVKLVVASGEGDIIIGRFRNDTACVKQAVPVFGNQLRKLAGDAIYLSAAYRKGRALHAAT